MAHVRAEQGSRCILLFVTTVLPRDCLFSIMGDFELVLWGDFGPGCIKNILSNVRQKLNSIWL